MKTIPLTQGYEAIIDDDDYERVAKKKWHVSPGTKTKYAVTCRKDGRKTSLHRLIMGHPVNVQIDHINGNGLDCRKINLRTCTARENHWNSRKRSGTKSKYKGVCPRGSIWRAYITVPPNKGMRELGRFASEVDAARAYDRAAILAFGAFANTNFPVHEYDCKFIGPLPTCGAVLNQRGPEFIAWSHRSDADAFLQLLQKALAQ